MADIKIDETDSTKINIEVADSNDLNLELTGGGRSFWMESGYDGSASGTDCGTGMVDAWESEPHVFKPPRFKHGYPTRK